MINGNLAVESLDKRSTKGGTVMLMPVFLEVVRHCRLDLNETCAKNLNSIHRITYKWAALDKLIVYNFFLFSSLCELRNH
jgi:hypothetical protein